MPRSLRFCAVVLLAGCAGLVRADRYVAQNGQTPGSPYDSWDNAATDIHTAVTAADPGETVWVSTGLYTRASSPVVSITKSISLRGVGDRDQIVIDGQSARRCIQIVIDAEPMNVLVEGFSVINGAGVGGGSFSGTSKWPAGGIMVNNTADVTASFVEIRNCLVTGCSSGHTSQGEGGGIMAWGFSAATDLSVRIAGCDIVGNYSATGGGGVHLTRVSFSIENSTIADNVVDAWDPFADPPVPAANTRSGGGISVQYAGPGSVIRNCVIENNRASRWGGGVLVRYDGELQVDNCIFRGNIAPSGAGINIAGHSGDPTNILRNCLFTHNWALTNNVTSGYGRGGGIKTGDTTLGAGKNVRVESCTVVSNTAVGYGGGVRIYTANGVTFWNSILYGNWANGNVNSNYQGTAAGWTNCLVGTGNVLPGSGNITGKDPLFVDFDNADYQLTRPSPCVDKGYYQPWMDTARDVEGNLRIHPSTGKVDIGAYEYQPQGTVITVL